MFLRLGLGGDRHERPARSPGGGPGLDVDSHVDGNGNGNGDADADPDADCDVHIHSHSDADRDVHGNRDVHPDADAHRHIHGHADRDAHHDPDGLHHASLGGAARAGHRDADGVQRDGAEAGRREAVDATSGPGNPAVLVPLRRLAEASAGVTALLLLAASLRNFAASDSGSGRAWALYAASISILVVSFWSRRAGARDEGHRVSREELATLAAVLVVGAVFRFHLLTTTPYGVWFDEAQNALEASRILHEPAYRPVFISGLSQMPAMPFFYDALFVWLAGPCVLAVRLGATVAGLLAIVALWLLGRELFGRGVGLAAAALLAVSRWHVDFSRFGVANIFVTLFAPLSLYLFFRSQRRESPREALLGGVLLGIGLQLYYAMAAVPILIGAAFLHAIAVGRWRGRKAAGLLALTLAGAGASYSPVWLYASRHPAQFTERMRTASAFHVGSLGELLALFVVPSDRRPEAFRILKQNTLKHAAMFHVAGDSNGRHNLPGAPMLDPVSGLLFGLGFLWCLLRARDTRHALLLLWFGAMISAGILSVDFEAPQAARTLGLTPVVALMGALVLVGACEVVRDAEGTGIRRAAGPALAVALVGAAGVSSWRTYFGKQLVDPGVFAAFSAQETKIGEVVRDEGRGADVFVPETLLGGPTETLLIGHPIDARPFDRSRDLPITPTGHKALLFFQGQETETVTILRRLYQRATLESFGPRRPDGTPGEAILWIARIPVEEIESVRGWVTEYRPERGSPVEEVTLATSWDWSRAPVPTGFSATVRGTLRVDKDGPYDIVLRTDAPATLGLDGERILTARGRRRLVLARGSHAVVLEVRPDHRASFTELRWVPPGGAEATIPSASLFSPRLPTGGLEGRYFPGASCEGEPAFRRIDPQVAFYFHILPLARPFAACWSGSVFAAEAGTYRFGTSSINESELLVDGIEVVRNKGVNEYVEGALDLVTGWHPIEVRYRTRTNYSQVYLYWTRPGATREPVPSERLRPSPPAEAPPAGEDAAGAWK